MDENYALAGEGMKKIYQGHLMVLVGTQFFRTQGTSIIGILALLEALAGCVFILIGLNNAAPAHPGFQKALYATVPSIFSMLLIYLFKGWLYLLINVIDLALNTLQIYYICRASSELLSSKGDKSEEKYGRLVWKIFAGVNIFSAVILPIPLPVSWASALFIISLICQAAVKIIFIIYSYNVYLTLLYIPEEHSS